MTEAKGWTKTSRVLGSTWLVSPRGKKYAMSAADADTILAALTAQGEAEALRQTINKRQQIWAQVGLRGKAEDDKYNADKLVAVDATVARLEEALRVAVEAMEIAGKRTIQLQQSEGDREHLRDIATISAAEISHALDRIKGAGGA